VSPGITGTNWTSGPYTAAFGLEVSSAGYCLVYDDSGVSLDTNPGAGNFDGNNSSYSYQALEGANLTQDATVVSGGLTYTSPNVASCNPDNIVAIGQTVELPSAPSGASELGLLGVSVNGSTSGTLTINYTDGTNSTQTLSFGDWGSPAPTGQSTVASMTYRNNIYGTGNASSTYVLSTTVPVDSSKTVASVTLPDISPAEQFPPSIHIFAFAFN
jgi:beta-glucosidase